MDGWLEQEMVKGEEEEEDRKRNRRTNDVEGKGSGDRERAVVGVECGGGLVKEEKWGEKKSGSPLFVPWVWQYQVNLGG